MITPLNVTAYFTVGIILAAAWTLYQGRRANRLGEGRPGAEVLFLIIPGPVVLLIWLPMAAWNWLGADPLPAPKDRLL